MVLEKTLESPLHSKKIQPVLTEIGDLVQLRSKAVFQAGFRKGRGTRDQIANIRWIIKKVPRVSGLRRNVRVSQLMRMD